MENRHTLSMLSSLLSESTGKSKKSCDDFLREFFKLAGDILASGENIRIKGFGSFKISEVESRASVDVTTGLPTEIAAHRKIVFTPSKEIVSIINKPFEIFESVEVDEEFELYEKDDIEDDWIHEPKRIKQHDIDGSIEIPAEETIDINDMRRSEKSNENVIERSIIEAGSDEEDLDDDITNEAYTEIMERNSNRQPNYYNQNSERVYMQPENQFGKGFLLGFLTSLVICLMVFIIGCFLNWWGNFGPQQPAPLPPAPPAKVEEPVETPVEEIPVIADETSEESPIIEPEPQVPVQTTPAKDSSSNKVYDTVTTTRYLTTIARDHYGDFNFWPYIYLENQSILGHPDRVTPGTRVVVPPLSKYGVNPARTQDLEKAKQKAQEIYSRFR